MMGYKETMMGNPLITWESSRNLNFGFDLSLFDNRLQTTFDWYKRTTSDILLQLAAPSSLGIKPAMENAGEIENKGWDLTINWRATIGNEFKYTIGVNLSDVRNEITDLKGYQSPAADLKSRIEGQPLDVLYG